MSFSVLISTGVFRKSFFEVSSRAAYKGLGFFLPVTGQEPKSKQCTTGNPDTQSNFFGVGHGFNRGKINFCFQPA